MIKRLERFEREVVAEDFVGRFRDEERMIRLCMECPSYGRSWGCPPFDFDTSEVLSRYRYARIIATRFSLEDKRKDWDEVRNGLRPLRLRHEAELRDLEGLCDGRAFSFVGECLHCGEETCSRLQGLPCRHPDKLRPSLESFGFDLTKTLSELFGIELLWSSNGVLPEYIVLVSALFHNSPTQ